MIRLIAVVRHRLRDGADRGFTLIELLVATALSLMVGAIVVSTLITATTSAANTTANANLNAEARDLLNRLTGDLRQATPVFTTTTVSGSTVKVETPAITAVQNPYPYESGGSANAVTSITFDADYNGDGCIDGVVSDGCPGNAVDPNNPEIESFCWNPATLVVYLVPGPVDNTCSISAAQPLLSGMVTGLKIEYDSNRYLYDADHNGVTTWQEVDGQAPPIGNGNGVLDLPDLNQIDSIKLDVTLSDSGHTQTYQAVVSLRNVQ